MDKFPGDAALLKLFISRSLSYWGRGGGGEFGLSSPVRTADDHSHWKHQRTICEFKEFVIVIF